MPNSSFHASCSTGLPNFVNRVERCSWGSWNSGHALRELTEVLCFSFLHFKHFFFFFLRIYLSKWNKVSQMMWENFLCSLDFLRLLQGGKGDVPVSLSWHPSSQNSRCCRAVWACGDSRGMGDSIQGRGLTLGMKGERQSSQQPVNSDPAVVKTPSKPQSATSPMDPARRWRTEQTLC